MTAHNPVADVPGSPDKGPVPYVTIIASTCGLLLPIAAIALLFWATRSTPSDSELSAENKLHELQASEERQLTTYEWIEKPAAGKPGVVRIPVQRGRELILSEMATSQRETKR